MRAEVRRILKEMKSFLTTVVSKPEEYFTTPKAFTRNRKLSLNNLCVFVLGNLKRSLSVELVDYFTRLKAPFCSKSALSKARYLLDRSLFSDWNKLFVEKRYDSPQKLLRWKGFFLKAIDGSTIALPDNDELAKEFGTQSNQHKSVPMARVGLEFDVLNKYCTAACLQHFSIGENKFATEFLSNSRKDDLRLYDRYFASFHFIYRHLASKVGFVMRCKLDFNKTVIDFVASGKEQAIVTFPITDTALKSLRADEFDVDKQTTVKVRLVRVDIGGTESEILITSLLDEVRYKHTCFKELYFMRWGVETQYDKLKNKFQIAAFTGHKPEAIYQDFYATIIAANIQNLVCKECSGKLESINKGREVLVNINQNVSIGLLKPRLMFLFIGNKVASVFDELMDLFLLHLELIRPERAYPRTKTVRLKGKYRTYKNYRRAH